MLVNFEKSSQIASADEYRREAQKIFNYIKKPSFAPYVVTQQVMRQVMRWCFIILDVSNNSAYFALSFHPLTRCESSQEQPSYNNSGSWWWRLVFCDYQCEYVLTASPVIKHNFQQGYAKLKAALEPLWFVNTCVCSLLVATISIVHQKTANNKGMGRTKSVACKHSFQIFDWLTPGSCRGIPIYRNSTTFRPFRPPPV